MMTFPRIFLSIKVLHLWSMGLEFLPPEVMIPKVLLWQRAGYVSKDVWNEMHKIVSKDLLPSQHDINDKSELVLDFVEETEKVHVTDERQKVCVSDVISERLIAVIYMSVYPSKMEHFALNALGLEKSEYHQIHTETRSASERNYKVILDNEIYSKNI